MGNALLAVALLALLAISGFFAGAETVLFSLSRHDRSRMKKSANRLDVLAAGLMDDPRSLLTTLLAGNMTCNVMIFVLSTLFINGLTGSSAAAAPLNAWEQAAMWLLYGIPPLLVTYVSDVFPKVIGSLNNTRIAPLIALPIATLKNALWPVTLLIDRTVMRPVHRLVGSRHDHAAFSTEELRELLEMSEQEGVIDVSENQLLQEVVRIADLKVRDVMTPRVDMVAFNIREPGSGGGGAGGGAGVTGGGVEKLVALFRTSHLTKIPVYDGQIDNIVGLIYAKTLLLEMGTQSPAGVGRIDLRRLAQPVRFVPEQQTLERLLVHLRQTRTQLAVVVDEFGGVVGVVALEDVVEQMVGEIHEPHDAARQAVTRAGADEYLVSGDLSVADWMEAFGARVEATHTTTVAGLIAASLKRLPREGDEVRLANLLMRVDSMRGRRVDRVRLKLIGEQGETAAGAASADGRAAGSGAGAGEVRR